MVTTMAGRLWLTRGAIGRAFGAWLAPFATLPLFALLRTSVAIGMALDPLFFPRLRSTRVERPIIIVGNPRTGTTFVQRWLADQGIGVGMPLWRMLYPSLVLQTILRPFIPFLEKVSPARHHSSAAHETSLQSVETDDVAVFFRYFDGFFLYGFLLAWADEDHRPSFDPRNRDTSGRDFDWLEALWRRSLAAQGGNRVVAKLFSLGPRLPAFLRRFPDARVLYLVRDPVEVIPSGMSLVTGVLDKRFGFWSLPDAQRARYLERLYQAFVELFQRFHEEWMDGQIDRSKVMIVPFPRIMRNFDGLMGEVLDFVGHTADARLLEAIRVEADKQRSYRSGHAYDLAKFGLDEARIRKDCAFVYETFLP